MVECVFSWQLLGHIAAVFLAYFIAGKVGQATTNIRSSNLGPVWPAYGIALAAFLTYGYRVWPGIAASAFVVAVQSSVSPLAAAGQAGGATVAALTGALLLRRIPNFQPSLSRLRDALGLVVLGAFGSALISSSIGISALYATGIQPYSGLITAWFIYWLGDSTGVLLVTPLVFTLPQLLRIRSWSRIVELFALVTLLTGACFVIFGDLAFFPFHMHALAFGVLPFVMWGAIDFGIAGAALSVFLIAAMATVLTAMGFGPFSENTAFINAVLLDVLFAVLSISGLALAAVIAERERVESERERLIRERATTEARLRLAAIVEWSNDAIVTQDLDGIIQSWNATAEHLFGFTAAEAIGQPVTMLIPPERREEENRIRQKLSADERIEHFETVRVTKALKRIDVSLTLSPLRDAAGRLVGGAKIVRDITDQKRANEALSRVSGKLIAAQEQERARIARELHDDIGQRLAMLTIQLGRLTHGSPGVRSPAIELARQASALAADVQALSHQLHQSKLDLLGLSASVKLFCDELSDQKKVRIDCEVNDIPSQLPPSISLTLFRILQEAVHNSVKHSGARQCSVQLWKDESWIHLLVRDAGTGFDVEEAKRGRGIGLIGMEERVKLVDGDLSIESQLQSGTTIHARVPFTPSETADDA